jgi:hypothetical protein
VPLQLSIFVTLHRNGIMSYHCSCPCTCDDPTDYSIAAIINVTLVGNISYVEEELEEEEWERRKWIPLYIYACGWSFVLLVITICLYRTAIMNKISRYMKNCRKGKQIEPERTNREKKLPSVYSLTSNASGMASPNLNWSRTLI